MKRYSPALVAAASLVGAAVAIPLVSSADAPAPQPGVGRSETCLVDSTSYCTIQHGLGVKPSSIQIEVQSRAAQSHVPAGSVTATQYRVRFVTASGAAYAAGTRMDFFAHYDFTSDVVEPPPSPTPTPTPTPASWSCVREKADGNIGCPENGATPGYVYPKVPNSNGYTTYVGKDCWGNPECQYKLEANNPGDWQITANEPAGNTSVRTYPDAQQLTNNWCPNDPGYKDCTVASTFTPIKQLTKLTSTYAESTPAGDDVIAQFAWDIWTKNNDGHPSEIMVWVDNHNRGSGGATQKGTATIAGQEWTIYQFGTDELIFSLGAPGEFKQQTSGTVDLLAILNESIRQGFTSADAQLSQINAGWEICSTGGQDRTFKMTDYAIDMTPQ